MLLIHITSLPAIFCFFHWRCSLCCFVFDEYLLMCHSYLWCVMLWTMKCQTRECHMLIWQYAIHNFLSKAIIVCVFYYTFNFSIYSCNLILILKFLNIVRGDFVFGGGVDTWMCRNQLFIYITYCDYPLYLFWEE